MAAGNRYWSWFSGSLAEWSIEGGGPFAYPDLRYFSAVFRALEQLRPDDRLRVVATDDLTAALPLTGPDVVVLVVGDEFAVTPAYAHDVRLVAKTMGGAHRRPYVALLPASRWPQLPFTVAQEVRVQLRRLPWSLRSAARRLRGGGPARVLDVPLGIRAFEDLEEVPFERREFDVAFAGSLVNEAREHERRWPSQKLRARRAFLAEVERLEQARPDLAVWLRVLDTHWDGTAVTASYSRALANSRLVLCPRGSSVDTHRYFEALRAGCVPIYEMLPSRDYYDGAPGVRVRSWSELPAVVDRLLSDPEDLLARHRASLEWYDRWVSPVAVANRIARALAGARA